MSRKTIIRIALVAVIAALVASYYVFGLDRYFSLEYFKAQRGSFEDYYQANMLKTLFLYGLIYTLFTALSLPAASVIVAASSSMSMGFTK